jgi:hypothetical protein
MTTPVGCARTREHGKPFSSHLAALVARLAAAEAGNPGSGAVAVIAREILDELAAAVRGQRRAEDERDTAIVVMRASVADARDGCTDPLSHVRRYLTPRGRMPRDTESSLILLAWGPAGPRVPASGETP